MNPAQECLYDVAWQTRRLRYINTWVTEVECHRNIHAMLRYIGQGQDRYWKFVRVWRCRNIMNHALKNAEKHENAAGVRLIKSFTRGLEIEYDRYRGSVTSSTPFKKWNWGKVSDDLTKLYYSDRELFNRLQVYSETRLYAGGKQHPTDPAAQPELAHFVRRMRDVVFEEAK
jgi:hypothetical protein